MAFELNGFSDAILGQLSQIGIEIFNDKNNNGQEELVPKAIYEISKQSSKGAKFKDSAELRKLLSAAKANVGDLFSIGEMIALLCN